MTTIARSGSLPAADADRVARYLDALGVEGTPSGVDGLVRLHQAHADRFPHDTVWIARRRIPPLEQTALVDALLAGEGGGCVQLNAGLAWLLARLGYAVSLHPARLQRAFEPALSERVDAHLVLLVDLPDGRWWVDPGLGTGLREPVPLREGPVEQGGFHYRLEPVPETGAWRFHHDPRLMAIKTVEALPEPAPLERWAPGFHADATDEASRYVRVASASRRTDDAVIQLVGRTLLRVTASTRRLQPVADAQDWERVLREDFGLALPGLTAAERDEIWARQP